MSNNLTTNNVLGPYYFQLNVINEVTDYHIGNYIIYNKDDDIVYIGRGNIKDRFLNHILMRDYIGKYFIFSYAPSETEARIKECELYHRFYEKINNKVHPSLNNGEKCPFCDHITH